MTGLTENDRRVMKLRAQRVITPGQMSTPEETAREYLYCEECDHWFDNFKRKESHVTNEHEADISKYMCDMINKYLEKHAPSQAAQKFDIPKSTILKHDHSDDTVKCKRHRDIISPSTCARIRSEYRNNKTQAEIANKYNFSRKVVQYHVTNKCDCSTEAKKITH